MTPDDIALGEIKEMKDFVVKPVDKGGKIVIWPIEQYLKEAERQLSDTKYYEQQTVDHTTNTAYEFYTFLTYLNTNYYMMKTCSNFSHLTIHLEHLFSTCFQKYTNLTIHDDQLYLDEIFPLPIYQYF